MTDRLVLVGYLATVVTTTLVHEPIALALGLGLALALSGRPRWRLLRRALLSILLFNLTVSLGYWVLATWRGDFRADYLLLVNLRVLLLVYLGFWLVSRINLPRALGFSPSLAFVATLAAGQIQGFRRSVADFQFALRSRSPVAPTPTQRLQAAAAHGQHLLDRALHAATETGLAMRSRGSFND